MSDEEEDLMPQSLVTPTISAMAAAVGASLVLSISSSQTLNGEVVAFKDWGAVAGGGVALLLGLVALKDVFGALAGSKRFPRLGIVAVLSGVALWRIVYGLGLLI